MRILYDHQLFSRQVAGGASRYYYELARHLSGVPDVEADLWMGINSTIYPFQELSSANIHVKKFDAPFSSKTWRYVANETLSNCAVPFLGKVDVYHPTLYRRMPLVRTRRVVATHYDCTQERFPDGFPHRRMAISARQSLYARADAIICTSESGRRDLLEFYGVDTARTRVIYLGLSRFLPSPAAAAMLRKYLRREYVLFVGARAPYKNFNALLKAFYRTGLADWLDLLVLGGGPLTVGERALITDLNLSDCLISIPKASDELLGEAYAAATLFVYPSFWEGFGCPPLEAMAAGCPVLASNTSAIPEVCLNAPFYFDPHDQDSFNSALLVAINDDEARRQAIEKGGRVAARYSWSKCGEETLALYRECQ